MTIKKFIESAIKGGWKKDSYYFSNHMAEANKKYWWTNEDRIREAVLDKEAWQAVYGKKIDYFEKYDKEGALHGELIYVNKMHAMIDALAEDKSISEFLKTL